jgi:hypothetical protein
MLADLPIADRDALAYLQSEFDKLAAKKNGGAEL